VVASLVVSVAVSGASGFVLDLLNVGPSVAARAGLAFVIDLAMLGFDLLLFLGLFRYVGRIRLPWPDLFSGALVGAVGLFLLEQAGGLVLHSASRNQFLAASSLVVGLLVLFNLVARLTLVAAAWAATNGDDRGTLPALVGAEDDSPENNRVPLAVKTNDELPEAPGYGQRSADRVTIAAGVVLGVAGVSVLGVVCRGLAAVRDGLRPKGPR
jgi:membrane protein